MNRYSYVKFFTNVNENVYQLQLWKNSQSFITFIVKNFTMKVNPAYICEKIHNESILHESDIHASAFRNPFHCEKIHKKNCNSFYREIFHNENQIICKRFHCEIFHIVNAYKCKLLTNVTAFIVKKFTKKFTNTKLFRNVSVFLFSICAFCKRLQDKSHA